MHFLEICSCIALSVKFRGSTIELTKNRSKCPKNAIFYAFFAFPSIKRSALFSCYVLWGILDASKMVTYVKMQNFCRWFKDKSFLKLVNFEAVQIGNQSPHMMGSNFKF